MTIKEQIEGIASRHRTETGDDKEFDELYDLAMSLADMLSVESQIKRNLEIDYDVYVASCELLRKLQYLSVDCSESRALRDALARSSASGFITRRAVLPS